MPDDALDKHDVSMQTLLPHEILVKAKHALHKACVSFVQIGVNDGIAHDVANLVLTEHDAGHFIEPIKTSFDVMCNNKKQFKKCTFMQKAVVPECMAHVTHMNILSDDDMNQGASVVNSNAHRIVNQVAVDCITVQDLIKSLHMTQLDFLFCDAEGVDHLIILDFIQYMQPQVIFFESGHWSAVDTIMHLVNGSNVVIPCKHTMQQSLHDKDYYVFDYASSMHNKREDMIAIKNDVMLQMHDV